MARYILGQKVPDEFNTVIKVKEQQRKLGVKVDGIWGPEPQAAYQASLKAAQHAGRGQYGKMPGLSGPHFSSVSQYAAYEAYPKDRYGANKGADTVAAITNVIHERAGGVGKTNAPGLQITGADLLTTIENGPVSGLMPTGYGIQHATTGAQQKHQAVNSKNRNTPQQNLENYLYATKPKTKEDVAELIRDNAQYIKEAAEAYGVDPRIIAGVIYAEQVNNVNYEDVFGDWIGFYGLLDTSIGLGQVKVSTAKIVEDMGYIPKTSATEGGWEFPVIGPVHGTETMAREMRLENNQMNIMYVAAYLRYWQDVWEDVYPQISNDPAILGTLYNLGVNAKAPNKSPQSTPFGDYVEENYAYLGQLLGLDS